MKFINKGDPFDISLIISLEEAFNIKIPQGLKKYYLKYGNSRVVKPCEFEVDGFKTDVSEFVSINKNDKASFYEVMDSGLSDGWIPDNFYPIAHDYGGNYYFWDSTNEHVYLIFNDDVENPVEICKSIKDFFKLIKKNQ